jgi:hypothetical protein
VSNNPPQTFVRNSSIPDDISVIVARWGPSIKDGKYRYTLRGVPVSPTCVQKVEQGRSYRMCIFPDHAWQWVNEGNIEQRKLSKYTEETA